MAVGVVFSDRRIRGSCGGLAGLEGRHGKMSCAGCPSGGENCAGSHHGAQQPHGPCESTACESEACYETRARS
jgi:hypothetical protein